MSFFSNRSLSISALIAFRQSAMLKICYITHIYYQNRQKNTVNTYDSLTHSIGGGGGGGAYIQMRNFVI